MVGHYIVAVSAGPLVCPQQEVVGEDVEEDFPVMAPPSFDRPDSNLPSPVPTGRADEPLYGDDGTGNGTDEETYGARPQRPALRLSGKGAQSNPAPRPRLQGTAARHSVHG